jgi:vacuolar protein sorting-associated protein IST1
MVPPPSLMVCSLISFLNDSILILSVQAKLKVQLKLAIARLRMVQQKDEALSKRQRREMALLLEAGKVESARIRVENIIRTDILTELHEILELYCELLLARIGMVEGRECDPGLEEAVKSIMYAAPRIDVKEVQQIRQLLAEKYGKEFALQATENSDGKVAERVIRKLSVTPPSSTLVNAYMEEIARTYGVNWPRKPPGEPPKFDDDTPSDGHGIKIPEAPLLADGDAEVSEREELSKATPPRDFAASSPLRVNPPSPSTDNLRPRIKGVESGVVGSKLSSAAGREGVLIKKTTDAEEETIPDINELARRFAALKK